MNVTQDPGSTTPAKKTRWPRRLGMLVSLLALLAGIAVLGPPLERFMNRVEPGPLPKVSPQAARLHDSAFVVDLHADSLLFGRDLSTRSDTGHVDLPRLREGGVGLQVFAAPTVVPLGMNMERTSSNALDLLDWSGDLLRPGLGRSSPMQRALLIAQALEALARESGGRLVVVRSREDLRELQEARSENPGVVGAVLAIEGAHAMEGDPDNLQVLFDAGYRIVGLTHFFDNAYAGSAHGEAKGGLSPLGRQTLAEMQSLGMLADIAHLSPRATHELLDQASTPVVFSHGGVKGTCDNTRNLSDAMLQRVADGGGVVGIGYWDWATCGTAPGDVARAVRYVIDAVGDNHVALGSDYDGGVSVSFDTSQLPVLTQAMLEAGIPEPSIRKVLGENALRVLDLGLPWEGDAESAARARSMPARSRKRASGA